MPERDSWDGTFGWVSGLTVHELYERTQVKTNFLKQQGWQVVEMCKCEFHDFLQRNTVAKTYVDSLKDIVHPLNPRDHKNEIRQFYQSLRGHQ